MSSLGQLHRIFTAVPDIKFRACVSERPKDPKLPGAGPPDAWRKICLRWQQGEPLSLEDTWKAMSDGRYIAYVPETAGLVGLDLDKGDFETAERRIAREYPHAVRVTSASGNAYHVLFAAPQDRSQELPYQFSVFGGQGIVRHDKGYLCFNSDAYLAGLTEAVEMAAEGTLPEVPLDRLTPATPSRSTDSLSGSPKSNRRRGSSIELIADVLREIDPGCKRDVWLRVGMGIHDETQSSDEGYELFDRWSAGALSRSGQPDNYAGSDDTRKAWDSFTLRDDAKRVTFATVVSLARTSGHSVPPEARRGSANNHSTSDASAGNGTAQSGRGLPGLQAAVGNNTQFDFSRHYWETHPDHLFDWRTGTWWGFAEGKGWYRPNAERLMRQTIEDNTVPTKNPRPVHRLVTVTSSLALAAHELRTHEDHKWDYSLGVVGLENGMAMDLKEGNSRAAEKTEYLTRQLRCRPAEQSGDWEKVVARWCGGDQALARYLQVTIGYTLYGDPREQIFVVIQGPSATGKSRFLATIAHACNDYAQAIPVEIFAMQKNASTHPTGLASLDGPRFLHCSEVDENAAWNTTRLKSVTGGDIIAARFMRRDFFNFRPQGVVWIALNDLPGLRVVSDAIRRRIRVVPFHEVIPKQERDTGFDARWQKPENVAQVVRWALEGARMYAESGLPDCPAVSKVTKRYLDSEDVIGRFLDELVEFTGYTHDQVTRKQIRTAAEDYAQAEGRKMPRKGFYHRIFGRGAKEVKRRGTRYLLGVRLKSEHEESHGQRPLDGSNGTLGDSVAQA